MTQFDQESVKGTDIEGDEELDDDAVKDAEEGDGAAKVGDTIEEVTSPSEAAPETQTSGETIA